jgi:NADH-quinone oxidoreductase subunit A
MPKNYIPILMFMALGFLFPVVTLAILRLIRPSDPHKAKLSPYECGVDPVYQPRERYTVRYYIVAILFVVFDVETVFLFPWAIRYDVLGLFGLMEMLVFLGILVVGFIWLWKQGALEWV